MYLKHFGFDAAPFAINPDPRFLYLSPKHQEALAHLLYGLGEGGGFVMLSGEVGTGKTTLCYSLLEHLGSDIDVAFIMNPRLGGIELLAALCDELHVLYPPATESRKVLIDSLNQFLLSNHAQGRRTVAVIDEAQNLSIDVLEQIRLLTNLETPTTKLLQIILVGQPELSELLARKEVRQVDQRITARYHLGPLDPTETRHYITHRLTVAGGNPDIFSSAALVRVFRSSKGVPRLINIICDRALLGAFTLDRRKVDASIVRKASQEIHRTPQRTPASVWLSGMALLFVAVTAVFFAPLIREFGNAAARLRSLAETGTRSSPEPRADPERIALIRDENPKSDSVPVTPLATAALSSSNLAGPQLVLADWLADPFFQEANALGQLLQRWRPKEPFRPSSCSNLAAAELDCLRLQSGWDRLLRQNLPTVLRLKLQNGRERSVALVAANDHQATLMDREGKPMPFPLQDVLLLWTGDSLVVWEPLANRTTYLAPGMSHPSIPMLRQRLTAAGFAAVPAGLGEQFDEPLTKSVVSFQRTVGIRADGIIGPETLVGLAAMLPQPGVPSLREKSAP